MINRQQGSLPRCLAVLTGTTAAAVALVAWQLPTATSPGTSRFDDALVRICAALAVPVVGWLWLGMVVTVVGAVRGRPSGRAGVPAPLRRVVLAACGVALTGGLLASAPVEATPGRPHVDRATGPAAVAGLPLPDRATAPPARTDGPDGPGGPVVVAPGDTLWAIAARDLGPDATDAEIDAAWRRLYALNRAEIGPDPDLIRPAQRLEVLP